MAVRLSVAVTVVAGVATVAAALLFRDQLPISRSVAYILGFSILYGGMGLFLWAGVHLRGAIAGGVTPRLDRLVTRGPFRMVRHPVYVGMVIAMVGASIVTRSAVGLLLAFVVFLPLEIHRARLEEQALEERFGSEWREYAARTGPFIPRIGTGSRKHS
jgi:protein-S-isoprenylcysteine O-methyltransferase Ste14